MADQNAKSNQESGVASTTRASLNSTTESPQQERQYTNHDSSGESTSYHKDHSSSSSEQEEPQSKHPQHPRRSSVSPDPSVRVSRETSALRKRSRDSGLTSSGSNEARVTFVGTGGLPKFQGWPDIITTKDPETPKETRAASLLDFQALMTSLLQPQEKGGTPLIPPRN